MAASDPAIPWPTSTTRKSPKIWFMNKASRRLRLSIQDRAGVEPCPKANVTRQKYRPDKAADARIMWQPKLR